MQHPKTDRLASLIACVATGDKAAFDALYNATADQLHAICLSVLKDRPSAEQALEQVYLAVWEGAQHYDPDRLSPMAWLVVLARNRAVDGLRVRHSRPRPLTAQDALNPAAARGAADEARVQQAQTRILPALAALPEAEAEAIRAVWQEGLSYSDLARRLDMPATPLRGWLRRGLATLKPGFAA